MTNEILLIRWLSDYNVPVAPLFREDNNSKQNKISNFTRINFINA